MNNTNDIKDGQLPNRVIGDDERIPCIPAQMVLDYEIRASWWAGYCNRPYLAWIASWWFSRKIKRKYPRYIESIKAQVDAHNEKHKAFYDAVEAKKAKATG